MSHVKKLAFHSIYVLTKTSKDEHTKGQRNYVTIKQKYIASLEQAGSKN